MKFGVLCFALVGLVFLNSGKIIAQGDNPIEPEMKSNPFYIGPVAGVNIVSHSTDLKTVTQGAGASLCPTLTDGSAVGFYFGISGEYFIGGAKDSKSSIIAKLVYNTMPANFEQKGADYPSVDASGQTINSAVDYSDEIKLNMITLEALYKLNFMDRFGVTAGLNFDYIMALEETKLMKLVADPNIKFKEDPNEKYTDNGRTLILGATAEKASLRIALKFGLQYEINGGKGIVVVPNVNYNLGLTNIDKNQDWSVSAIQMGIDVRFALGGN